MSKLAQNIEVAPVQVAGSIRRHGAAVEDFAAIVDQYEGPLLRYVGALLAGPADAEAQDVVQEAFLRLHRQQTQHGADSIGQLDSWLFRVAHNLARDTGRKRQRRQRMQVSYQQQSAGGNGQEPAKTALADLEQQEAGHHALIEMQRLPDHLREVLVLKMVQGMTLRQICDVTGLTVGNAGYRLNQALAMLAQRLKALGAI